MTGDAQGTMGKVKKGRFSHVLPVFSFPPSFACKFSSRERERDREREREREREPEERELS